MNKTDEELYNFCREHYYCGKIGESQENIVWQPFENYSIDEIEEFIDNDVQALKKFFKED